MDTEYLHKLNITVLQSKNLLNSTLNKNVDVVASILKKYTRQIPRY